MRNVDSRENIFSSCGSILVIKAETSNDSRQQIFASFSLLLSFSFYSSLLFSYSLSLAPSLFSLIGFLGFYRSFTVFPFFFCAFSSFGSIIIFQFSLLCFSFTFLLAICHSYSHFFIYLLSKRFTPPPLLLSNYFISFILFLTVYIFLLYTVILVFSLFASRCRPLLRSFPSVQSFFLSVS